MAYAGKALVLGGKLSVGITAVQLTTITSVWSVYLEADEDNANKIYVGDSTVTTDKYLTVLSAGQGVELADDHAPVTIGIDPSKVYVISDGASQAVQWGYLR